MLGVQAVLKESDKMMLGASLLEKQTESLAHLAEYFQLTPINLTFLCGTLCFKWISLYIVSPIRRANSRN